MRRATALAIGVHLVVASAVARADTAPNFSAPPARAPEPVTGVAEMVTPTTQALAAAAITTKSESTTFRATFVPLRALPSGEYIDVLSETKLSIKTDTSTNQTRSSLSLLYNPFALGGHRHRALLAQDAPPIGQDVDSPGKPVCEAEPTASCGELQRVAACASLKAIGDATRTLEQAQATETECRKQVQSTFGGEPAAFQTAVAALILASVRVATTQRELAEANARRKTLLDEAKTRREKCNKRRLADEWPQLNRGLFPAMGVTGFVDTYPFGSTPDPVNTAQTLDLEPWGGAGVEPNLSFHFHERFTVDVYGRYSRRRASGDPGTKLANYLEGGATASGIAWEFLTRDELQESEDYYREGFIPGLVVGASAQYSECDGRQACAKLRTVQRSVTPFVDVRVKPALQLRFSTVISWFDAVSKDGNDVAPSLSIAGQVGSP